LVQCIKLAEQVCGRGSEQVRAPRQLLQGEERQQVIQMVEHALETRLDLSKYNL
ncbi:dihydrodipicolinate synthase family protein, partial [Vibrio parahaemolyticus]|nr:dihydrodipicolinate synthase family protein [Vibrio parahaemolyticus]